MAFKFSTSQRYGIFEAHNRCCYWCQEPLDWLSVQIDHIVPQSLLKNQDKLSEVLTHYALPHNYAIDDFANWVPSHGRCNGKKSDAILALSPAMVSVFHECAEKGAKAKSISEKWEKEGRFSKVESLLRTSVETGNLAQENLVALRLSLDSVILKQVTNQEDDHVCIGDGEQIKLQLQTAHNLIKTGYVKAAQHLIEGLRQAPKADSYSLDTRVAIANALGDCHILLNELSIAESEFDYILTLKPDNYRALSKKSAFLRVRGDFELALSTSRKALKLAKSDILVAINHSLILATLKLQTELDAFVKQHPETYATAAGLLTLGLISLENDEFQVAIGYFESAQVLQPEDPEIAIALAATKTVVVQTDFFAHSPIDFVLPEEIGEEVKNVISDLSQALTLSEKQDYTQNQIKALNNRACCYGLLKNSDAALKDLDAVLKLDPSTLEARANKARLLYSRDLWGDAIDCLQEFGEISELTGKDILAECYYKLERYEEALPLFKICWQASRYKRVNLVIAERWVELEHRLNGADAAESALASIDELYGDLPEALRIRAHQRTRIGKHEEALELLLQARDLANLDKHWYSVDIAHAYAAAGQGWKGSDEFIKVAEELDFDLLWQDYIKYACDIRNFNSAAYRARSLRLSRGKLYPPFTEHVELKVLEYQRDFTGIIALLEFWQKIEPLPFHLSVLLISAYQRFRNIDLAFSTFAKINQAHLSAPEKQTWDGIKQKLAKALSS